jgi:hypothetical protein
MAYTIKFTDHASDVGKTSFTIDPNTTDGPGGDTTHTSLTLYGRGYSNYGEGLWTNLVHMLEHFCGPDKPPQPTVGQIWYDSAADVLHVYKNFIDDTSHNETKDWVALCDTKSIKNSLSLYLKTGDLLTELGNISTPDKLFGVNDFTRGLHLFLDGGYLPITGGTLTGNLILPVDETLDDYQAIYYKFLKDNYLTKADFDDALSRLLMPPATALNIGFEGSLFGTGLDVVKNTELLGYDVEEWGIGIDMTNPAAPPASTGGGLGSNINNNSTDPASSIYLQLKVPSDAKRSTLTGGLKLDGSLTLLNNSTIQLVEDGSNIDDPLTSLVNGANTIDPAKAYQAATKKYVYDRTTPNYVAGKLKGNVFFVDAVQTAIASSLQTITDSIATLRNSLAGMIGVGQTWQDMKASRVSGTTYTNNTGKPIQIIVTLADTMGRSTVEVIVGGLVIIPAVDYDIASGSATFCVQIIIPNNTDYKITHTGSSAGSIHSWFELR